VGIRRRRVQAEEVLEPRLEWSQRVIALIHDRPTTERICADWQAAGWTVMTIDEVEPTRDGHPVHVVRLAVPPPGWPALPDDTSQP
jgi:hypothetical protein